MMVDITSSSFVKLQVKHTALQDTVHSGICYVHTEYFGKNIVGHSFSVYKILIMCTVYTTAKKFSVYFYSF